MRTARADTDAHVAHFLRQIGRLGFDVTIVREGGAVEMRATHRRDPRLRYAAVVGHAVAAEADFRCVGALVVMVGLAPPAPRRRRNGMQVARTIW